MSTPISEAALTESLLRAGLPDVAGAAARLLPIMPLFAAMLQRLRNPAPQAAAEPATRFAPSEPATRPAPSEPASQFGPAKPVTRSAAAEPATQSGA